MKRNTVERIIASLDAGPDSCWTHPKPNTKSGYGYVYINNKTVLAHKLIYEHLHGKVQDGLQLDHLCRNRACANPAHLEPVTQSVNLRRGNHPQRDATECKRGHPFSEENTYIDKRGCRCCKACKRMHKERIRRKRGATVGRRMGEDHTQAKLTYQQVKAIREAIASGETAASQARIYGITVTHAWRLGKGEGWLHPNNGNHTSSSRSV